MEVILEYLDYPHNAYRARLIDEESSGRYVGQSLVCTDRYEAVEVVSTYNTLTLVQQPITLESALQRVRDNVSPTWEELYLQYLNSPKTDML